MKNIHIALITFVALVISILSCKPEKTVGTFVPQNLQDYISINAKNYEGSICIATSCQSFGRGNRDEGISYVEGYSAKKLGVFTVSSIQVSQNNVNDFYVGSSKELYSLFGTKAIISLRKDAFLREGNEFTSTINLPAPVQVISPISSISNNITLINNSEMVRWVTNSNSARPINIIIDFNNSNPLNNSFQNLPKVKKLIETEDDGQYQFSPSDFAGIPSGACVQIIVGRGDYVTPTNSTGQSYLITSFALSRADFRLQN